MSKYIEVINDLGYLLNTKNLGKGKKGFNLQNEFLSVVKVLKNDFKTEISTKFLFNLMRENLSLNNTQKRQKIRNLIRSLNTEKTFKDTRNLEVINYRTEIKDFGLNKWNEPTLLNFRLEHISKDFITTKREHFNFIKV